MNRSQRQNIIKALCASKEYLWDGNDNDSRYIGVTYVCDAIRVAYISGKINLNQHDAAADYIHEIIGGHSSVMSWLRLQLTPEQLVKYDKVKFTNHLEIQQYRLAWIDHMIAELSK